MIDGITPLITEPDNTYDFTNEEFTGEKRKFVSWFYIKKGVYVNYNYETTKYLYLAIREDDTHGLLFWEANKNSWINFNAKVQDKYNNWKADKILLTD